MKNFGVIVPARYKSSRFPGKPLALISGEYLILRVLSNLRDCIPKDRLWVATDDQSIKSVCEDNGYSVVLTPEACLTGTDRIAEANKILDFDYVVNVQGDEPLLDSKLILNFLDYFLSEEFDCVNCYSAIHSEEMGLSVNVPKLVFSESKKLLYISRSPIPLNKDGEIRKLHKQVCVYGFSKSALSEYGIDKLKTPLESIEDIEILRLIEKDFDVMMYELNSHSHAVDIPEDVAIVEELLRRRG